MYVKRHLFNEAVLITPPIIVYSPVKSTLANPKEPWLYFPRQKAAAAARLFSHSPLPPQVLPPGVLALYGK